MQSLVSEYKSYLQTINEIPRKMFAVKFGLITLEIVGSFSLLWNVFTFFGEFRSIAFICIGLGYAGVRLYFAVVNGITDARLRKIRARKEEWEQEQREKGGIL